MGVVNWTITQIPLADTGIIMHVVQLLVAKFFSSAFLPVKRKIPYHMLFVVFSSLQLQMKVDLINAIHLHFSIDLLFSYAIKSLTIPDNGIYILFCFDKADKSMKHD